MVDHDLIGDVRLVKFMPTRLLEPVARFRRLFFQRQGELGLLWFNVHLIRKIMPLLQSDRMFLGETGGEGFNGLGGSMLLPQPGRGYFKLIDGVEQPQDIAIRHRYGQKLFDGGAAQEETASQNVTYCMRIPKGLALHRILSFLAGSEPSTALKARRGG
ncbi:MAG TPA: hypothetical protein PKA61_05005 [Nitrospira sp.]|nr:hypothetical protein [Nitrospira sp.]